MPVFHVSQWEVVTRNRKAVVKAKTKELAKKKLEQSDLKWDEKVTANETTALEEL